MAFTKRQTMQRDRLFGAALTVGLEDGFGRVTLERVAERAGVSKGRRLAEFIAQQGIQPHEVIAFGDQNNDKEMLELAGLGVAMGNSREEIRDCADWVTGTNDSDGIADVLHRFVLTAA